MIDEVDDAIRTVIRREVLNGSDIDVVFDAPTKDWASRRNAPTIDVYLYDIREDLNRREYGQADVRNSNGQIVARHGPPRFFKFSYLVTAWTQRPEDEHRLLSAVLRCFLRFDALPSELFGGTIAASGYPVGVRVGQPPPQDRSVSDVWSALGGELKPSLDLVTTVGIDARALTPTAAIVTEGPRIGIRGAEGQLEEATAKPNRRGPNGEDGEDSDGDEAAAAAVLAKAEVGPGSQNRPGRVVRMRATNDR
jgi:hypothetical protein